MPVAPALIPPGDPVPRVTDPGRLPATILLVALLVVSPLLPGPAADGALPPAASAAPSFSPAPGVLLARVYPYAARDDEFVEIANAGETAADLGGWSLSDREATAAFPAGTRLAPGARLVATRNSTSFAEDVRRSADFTYDRGDAARMEGGVLRLADTGDEVLLLDLTGTVVDAYVYGTSAYAGVGWDGPPAAAPGRGEVATRRADLTGWQDTDRAEDWSSPRPYRIGQSAFEPPPVDVDSAPEVLVSPDDGRDRLLAFLGSATHSVEVAVYTLTSEPITSVLADRALAGVRVRVLLEGAPVGGLEESERTAVDRLLAAGAQVRFLAAAGDAVKRYRYLHAKYAIVDGTAVLVASENFGDSGFPAAGDAGNRGWSVIVDNLGLAGQLWEVFEEDFDPSRSDSVAATPGAQPAAAAPVPAAPRAVPEHCVPWHARLVLAPDTSLAPEGLLGAFAAARDRIWIEAFYADDPWGDGPNPFLDAAFAAARRGVSVRILLDGSRWSAEEDSSANEALAGRLNDRAHADGVDLQARVLAPEGSVERLHNKGAIVDGTALVSSMNWARGSATDNREVGLLLDEPSAVDRLAAAFQRDWAGDLPAFTEEPMIGDPTTVLALYAFVAAASALSLRKMRRRDKGLKPRSGMVRRGLLRAALRRRHREVRLLPPELVAEPRDGAGGGARDRGGGEKALEGGGGPPGDREP